MTTNVVVPARRERVCDGCKKAEPMQDESGRTPVIIASWFTVRCHSYNTGYLTEADLCPDCAVKLLKPFVPNFTLNE